MSDAYPLIYLARHGETAWSRTGQHTGLTDLPLTEQGTRDAIRLGERLQELNVVDVLTSPLQRASRTCELAGFGSRAKIDQNLVEWDYGSYEGLRSEEIRRERPDWLIFRDGCPGGETPAQVGLRADQVIDRIRATSGNVLLFSSAHFLRILAARWLGLEPAYGKYLLLSTASLSILGYEHNLQEPVIRRWNDVEHLNS